MLLTIEKLIYGGDGLARAPLGPDGRSMAVFVPFVLPGERIETEFQPEKAAATKGFARASVTTLVEASPERIAPGCPYFQRCGGCHYQHIPYERQLEFKTADSARDLRARRQNRTDRMKFACTLRRRGITAIAHAFRCGRPGFRARLFRFGSREFLPVRECPISSPLINRAIARLAELDGLNLSASG